jgi:hypothetical protein
MVAARVGRLFLRFPGTRIEDAEATVAAYATDLSRFPLWAVDRGLMMVIEGRSYGTGAFAPSSVECQRECEKAMSAVRAEIADLSRVLSAAVYHEVTESEREKVKAGGSMKSAEEILREPIVRSARSSLIRHAPRKSCGCICNADLAAIRAAQIDAAEWMREEAAKVAETGKGWGKMFRLTPAPCTDAAAKAIRSIKLPGDGE